MTPLEACKIALPLVEDVASHIAGGGSADAHDAETLADVGIMLRNAIREGEREADVIANLLAACKRALIYCVRLERAGTVTQTREPIATLYAAIGKAEGGAR